MLVCVCMTRPGWTCFSPAGTRFWFWSRQKIHWSHCLVRVCVCVWVRRVYCDKGVSGFSHPGLVQRDLWSPERSPVSGGAAQGGGGGVGNLPPTEGGVLMCAGERAMLRKTVSIDEQLLQVGGREQPHLSLWRRLERGHTKACSIQVSGGLQEVENDDVHNDFSILLSATFGATHDFYSSAVRVSRPSPEGISSARFSVLPLRNHCGGIPGERVVYLVG